MANLYLRLFLYLFTVFGLLVALPLIVWDLAADHLPTLFAVLFTAVSVFVPIGLICRCWRVDDAEDEEVPFRIRQDAVVRASRIAGVVLGIAAVVWMIL